MATLHISEETRTNKTCRLFRQVARENTRENFDIPDDNTVLFAYETKKGSNRVLIGVACYLPAVSSKDSFHFLNYIFVRPFHQRKGYGAALLKRVEASMLSKLQKPIRVESAYKSVCFFEKNGYHCQGEVIECVHGGAPIFSRLQVMEKPGY